MTLRTTSETLILNGIIPESSSRTFPAPKNKRFFNSN